jgi:hypothetical protein
MKKLLKSRYYGLAAKKQREIMSARFLFALTIAL